MPIQRSLQCLALGLSLLSYSARAEPQTPVGEAPSAGAAPLSPAPLPMTPLPPPPPYPIPATPMPQMPPPYPLPMAPPPMAIPDQPGAPGGGVYVHMTTNDLNATLSRFKGFELRPYWGRYGSYLRRVQIWSRICRAPCDEPVDPDGYYEIDGIGIRDSRTFQLPTSGAVNLDVKAGHPGTLTGGVLLTTFGALPLIVGLVFTPLGAALYQRPEGTGFLITGGVTLAVGIPLVAGGIYMLATSRTRVYTSEGYRLASRRWPRLAIGPTGLHF